MKALILGSLLLSQMSFAATKSWVCMPTDRSGDHWYAAKIQKDPDGVLRIQTLLESIYGGGVINSERVKVTTSEDKRTLFYLAPSRSMSISTLAKNGKYQALFKFRIQNSERTQSMECE